QRQVAAARPARGAGSRRGHRLVRAGRAAAAAAAEALLLGQEEAAHPEGPGGGGRRDRQGLPRHGGRAGPNGRPEVAQAVEVVEPAGAGGGGARRRGVPGDGSDLEAGADRGAAPQAARAGAAAGGPAVQPGLQPAADRGRARDRQAAALPGGDGSGSAPPPRGRGAGAGDRGAGQPGDRPAATRLTTTGEEAERPFHYCGGTLVVTMSCWGRRRATWTTMKGTREWRS